MVVLPILLLGGAFLFLLDAASPQAYFDNAPSAFHDLTTTDDGAQLYFSSELRLRNTDQVDAPKLFRYVNGHVELFAQRAYERDPHVFFPASVPYQFVLPEVSSDGTTVAYTAIRTCGPGSSCLFKELYYPQIVGNAHPVSFPGGRVQLSRNAAYALVFGSSGEDYGYSSRIDLASGNAVKLNGLVPADTHQSLTSSGAVLVVKGSYGSYLTASAPQLFLWTPTELRPVGNTEQPLWARINDAGTEIVYETSTPGGKNARLISLHVSTGQERTLMLAHGTLDPQDPARLTPQPAFHASISRDGHFLVYLARPSAAEPPQIFGQALAAAAVLQLTREPEGIREMTLAGDGRIAYAVTRGNRLLRIDIDTGGSTEIISRTPLLNPYYSDFVPGSQYRLTGSGLSEENSIASFPLPVSLAGVKLIVGETAAPLVFVTPTEIGLQVPWNLSVPTVGSIPVTLRLESDDSSPFENLPQTVKGAAVFPQFLLGDPAEMRFGSVLALAIHSGFDSLVTSANPAHPGEVLHFYLTGLGPVSPAVSSGEAGPANPLATVVSTPTAELTSFEPGTSRISVDVLFAGLAPGLIGIYQVDLRIPTNVNVNPPYVLLHVGSGVGGTVISIAP